VLDDKPNPENGTQDSWRSQDQSGSHGPALPQRSPAAPPTPKNETKTKPRLIVRLWRIHRRRQKHVAPPNVAEKITVLLILVTAFIGGVQAYIYHQQKTIMESSSGQTDQLIEAADTQARASRRIATASRRESRAADKNADAADSFSKTAEQQLGEMSKQAEAANKLAMQTQNNAEAARDYADTLLASERGWIKIADFEAGSDFWYTPNQTFQLTANYRLVNVGHSVITGIYFDAQMIVEYWGETMIQDVIDKEIVFCDEKRKERHDPRELRTLFPGDDLWSDTTVSISKQEMDEADKTWPNPYGNREPKVYPVIIGCVNYRLPFSNDIHQTRFAYNVNFADPTKPPIPKENLHGQSPFIVGRTIPQAQIDIRPHYFGGLYAD
jgi:hypothetical protein